MSALPIVLALVQLTMPPSRATAADSAHARAALDSVVVLLNTSDSLRFNYDLLSRLVLQQATWRDTDTAWRLAWKYDSTAFLRKRWHYLLTTRLTVDLLRQRKYRDVGRRLRSLPGDARATIIAGLQNNMGNMSAEERRAIEPLATSPVARAHLLRARAVELQQRGNLAAARKSLAAAISLLRANNASAYYGLQWAHDLQRVGGQLPVAELVELHLAAEGPSRTRASVLRARSKTARTLSQYDRPTAVALADTILREIAGDTLGLPQFDRSELLRIRAAPGDSVHADSIRARMDRAIQAAAGRVEPAGRRVDLMRSARARDTLALAQDLAALPAGQFSDELVLLAQFTASNLRAPYPATFTPNAATSAFASFVFRTLWARSIDLAGTARDSARVHLIALLAAIDPAAALDSARVAVLTQPHRDRAIAEAIRGLAAVDAARAADAARPLQDAAARNVAYHELTRRAVAGGLLAEAGRYADATAEGEARVSALFALAKAHAAAREHPEAITRLRAALMELDAVPRCDGMCFVLPKPDTRSPPQLILDVVLLALELGLTRDLQTWATSQSNDQSRATAWLIQGEAIAHLRLGKYIIFPVH
jgi:hypothetical protein